MNFDDVKDEHSLELVFKDWLEEYGWNVNNQVICDETKDWDYPWKADLIIQKQETPPIGIELKYMRGARQGSILSQAFKQLVKYSGKSFNGNKVYIWVFGLYIDNPHHESLQQSERQMSITLKEVISGFLLNVGCFGFLDLNERYLRIRFATTNDKIIDLGDHPYRDYQTDYEKIAKQIKKKRKGLIPVFKSYLNTNLISGEMFEYGG